jgi:hypothetical protein
MLPQVLHVLIPAICTRRMNIGSAMSVINIHRFLTGVSFVSNSGGHDVDILIDNDVEMPG